MTLPFTLAPDAEKFTNELFIGWSSVRLIRAALTEELADLRNEIERNLHSSVCCCLECGLVFGGSLFLSLTLVMLKNAANAFFVSPLQKSRLFHLSRNHG